RKCLRGRRRLNLRHRIVGLSLGLLLLIYLQSAYNLLLDWVRLNHFALMRYISYICLRSNLRKRFLVAGKIILVFWSNGNKSILSIEISGPRLKWCLRSEERRVGNECKSWSAR